MKSKLLLLPIILLTLSCCKRDDDTQTYRFDMPQEFKDYILFKKGTYWVYQNSKTKELDSIYIYESTNYIDTSINTDVNGTFIYESINYRAISSHDNYTLHYYTQSPIPENPSAYFPKLVKSKTKPGDYVGESSIFFHPFEINRKLYLSGTGGKGELVLENIYNSLMIAGNNFADVIQLSNSYDLTESKKTINYYFSKNIGLVKKENITDSVSWNLIRYNII